MIAALLVGTAAQAATIPWPVREPTLTMNLWEGDPPGMVQDAGPEQVDERGSAGNISVPGIAVYLPPAEEATGLAMIVAPGGSYRVVGYYTTGMGAVHHFLPKGVAIVVLKYRTRPPSKNVQADALMDAKRAVRLVRHHAKAWRIDPDRIGMLGSSAGSHLILNLATHHDAGDPDAADPVERQSCRPSFTAMLCPWPAKQSVDAFPIDARTPPTFVCSALDDEIAPTAFAEGIVAACREAGVAAELWTVERGGHPAFTIGGKGEGAKWVERFWPWLEEVGMRTE